MDNVLRAFFKSLPINIMITLLIGIACNDMRGAILGLAIGTLVFVIIASFIELYQKQ